MPPKVTLVLLNSRHSNCFEAGADESKVRCTLCATEEMSIKGATRHTNSDVHREAMRSGKTQAQQREEADALERAKWMAERVDKLNITYGKHFCAGPNGLISCLQCNTDVTKEHAERHCKGKEHQEAVERGMTREQLLEEQMMTLPQRVAILNGKYGNLFEEARGRIRCKQCDIIVTKENVERHCMGEDHKEAVARGVTQAQLVEARAELQALQAIPVADRIKFYEDAYGPYFVPHGLHGAECTLCKVSCAHPFEVVRHGDGLTHRIRCLIEHANRGRKGVLLEEKQLTSTLYCHACSETIPFAEAVRHTSSMAHDRKTANHVTLDDFARAPKEAQEKATPTNCPDAALRAWFRSSPAYPGASKAEMFEKLSRPVSPETLDELHTEFNTRFHHIRPRGCGICGALKASIDEQEYVHVDQFERLLQVPDGHIIRTDAENPDCPWHVQKIGTDWYHIDPDLWDAERKSVAACGFCVNSLRRKRIPRWSFATGWDYGRGKVLDALPKLSRAEVAAISMSVHFTTLHKIRFDTSLQHHFKHHIISFGSPGAKQVAKRLPSREQFIDVVFMGKNTKEKALGDVARRNQMRESFSCNAENMLIWLKFLIRYNALYKDIEIDEESAKVLEETMADQILNTATVDVDPEDIARDCLRQAYAPDPQEVDNVLLFANHAEPDDVLGGLSKAIESLRPRVGIDPLDCVLLEDKVIRVENRPLNEFSDNMIIAGGGFPDVMPCFLGEAVKALKSDSNAGFHKPLTRPQMHHCMMQKNPRFCKSAQFTFWVWDQLRRHGLAQTIKANAKTGELAADFMNDPCLMQKLQEAERFPDNAESRRFIKQTSTLFRTLTGKLPFSDTRRRGCLFQMVALHAFGGTPNVFFTISPADMDMRLTMDFVAGGDDAQREFLMKNTKARFEALEGHPAYAVEVFYLLIEAVFGTLIGVPCTQTKGSIGYTYDANQKMHLFGFAGMMFGVVEAQLRGALHFHGIIWAGPSSQMLSDSLLDKEAAKRCAKYGDSIISQEIPESDSRPLGDNSPSSVDDNSVTDEVLVKMLEDASEEDDAPRSENGIPTALGRDSPPLAQNLRSPSPDALSQMLREREEEDDAQRSEDGIPIPLGCDSPLLDKNSRSPSPDRLAQLLEDNLEEERPKDKKEPFRCALTGPDCPSPKSPRFNPHVAAIVKATQHHECRDACFKKDSSGVSKCGKRFPEPEVCDTGFYDCVEAAEEESGGSANGKPAPIIQKIVSGIDQALPPAKSSYFGYMPVDTRAKMFLHRRLGEKNGSITPYTPLITGLTGCNTAVYYLGCVAQAFIVMLYLVKYMSKVMLDVNASRVAVKQAQRTVKYATQNPIDDGVSDAVKKKRLIANRLGNAALGQQEVCAQLALADVMNKPADFCDRHIKNFDMGPATIAFMKAHALKQSLSQDDGETNSQGPDDMRPEEFHSESDIEVDDLLGHVDMEVAENGEVKVRSNWLFDYYYSGERFKKYSLAQYVCLVKSVPAKVKAEGVPKGADEIDEGGAETGGEETSSVSETGSDEASEIDMRPLPKTVPTPKRPAHGRFEFDEKHPDYGKRVQMLKAFPSIPKPYPGVPRWSILCETTPYGDWSKKTRAKAKEHATFMSVMHRPWNACNRLHSNFLSADSYKRFLWLLDARCEDKSDPLAAADASTLRVILNNTRIGLNDHELETSRSIFGRWRSSNAKTFEEFEKDPHSNREARTSMMDATGVSIEEATDALLQAQSAIDELPNDQKARNTAQVEEFIRTEAAWWGAVADELIAELLDATPEHAQPYQGPEFAIDVESIEAKRVAVSVVAPATDKPTDSSTIVQQDSNVLPSDTEIGQRETFLQSFIAMRRKDPKTPDFAFDGRQLSAIKAVWKRDSENCKVANLLVHGGPGVGKSEVMRAMRFVEEKIAPKSTRTCAPSGIAGYNVQGTTLHTLFHIPIMEDKEARRKRESRDDKPSAKLLNDLRAEFYEVTTVFIDEISMVCTKNLGIVSRNLSIATKNPAPFGGLRIVAFGDFFQLTAIGRSLLKGITPGSNEEDIDLFDMEELLCQHRAVGEANSLHQQMIWDLRDPCTCETALKGLIARANKIETASQIPANGIVFVAGVKEHAAVDRERALSFARGNNTHVILLNLPKGAKKRKDGATSIFFAPGKPVFHQENMAASGVYNGSRLILSRVVTRNQGDAKKINDFLRSNGKDIVADFTKIECTGFETTTPAGDTVTVKSVACGNCMTVHKAQGSTIDVPVCINLNKRPHSLQQLCDHSWLYVAVTRVSSAANIYLVAEKEAGSFDWIYALRPDPKVMAFLAGMRAKAKGEPLDREKYMHSSSLNDCTDCGRTFSGVSALVNHRKKCAKIQLAKGDGHAPAAKQAKAAKQKPEPDHPVGNKPAGNKRPRSASPACNPKAAPVSSVHARKRDREDDDSRNGTRPSLGIKRETGEMTCYVATALTILERAGLSRHVESQGAPGHRVSQVAQRIRDNIVSEWKNGKFAQSPSKWGLSSVLPDNLVFDAKEQGSAAEWLQKLLESECLLEMSNAFKMLKEETFTCNNTECKNVRMRFPRATWSPIANIYEDARVPLPRVDVHTLIQLALDLTQSISSYNDSGADSTVQRHQQCTKCGHGTETRDLGKWEIHPLAAAAPVSYVLVQIAGLAVVNMVSQPFVNGENVYRPVAFMVHEGADKNGHYVTVYEHERSWWLVDDDRVTPYGTEKLSSVTKCTCVLLERSHRVIDVDDVDDVDNVESTATPMQVTDDQPGRFIRGSVLSRTVISLRRPEDVEFLCGDLLLLRCQKKEALPTLPFCTWICGESHFVALLVHKVNGCVIMDVTGTLLERRPNPFEGSPKWAEIGNIVAPDGQWDVKYHHVPCMETNDCGLRAIESLANRAHGSLKRANLKLVE